MKKLIFLLPLVFSACTKDVSQPNIEVIQDMMEQDAVKAQKFDDFTESGISARVPPENTIPVGFKPYRYEKDLDGALKENKNPYSAKKAADLDPEVLLTGQTFYNTNCMVCHGAGGKGDGSIKNSYPLPIPSLLSDKVRNWQDANIYHVITMGQGTMGPYRSHIPAKYRWQVVQYIRHLQSTESGEGK